jgi:hypothetical protein
MPILKPTPAPHSSAVDPRIARTLWQWLALGAVAMLLVPAARGPVYLLGNMPFWLVLAPGIALLTLYRHALAAAWRAHLVRATPRRRRRFGARRVPKSGVRVHLSFPRRSDRGALVRAER